MRFHSIKTIVYLWVLALGLSAGVVRGQPSREGVGIRTVDAPGPDPLAQSGIHIAEAPPSVTAVLAEVD